MDSKQIFEAKFQNADVLKATGVSLGTLQTWLNRGLIKPSSDLTPGTGQRRMYSAADVLRVALMAELVGFGLKPSAAAFVLDIVERESGVRTSPNNARPKWMLISRNGVGRVVSYSMKDKIEDVWPAWNSQVTGSCLVVPVGAIEATVFGSLEAR